MIMGRVFVLRWSSEGALQPDGVRLVTQGALGVFRTLERAKAAAAAHCEAPNSSEVLFRWIEHTQEANPWYVCNADGRFWYVIEQCPLED